MFTRKDYLDKVCDRRQYYAQFVTQPIKSQLHLGMIDVILKSEDDCLNDISLQQWDSRAYIIDVKHTYAKMKKCGDTLTLSGIVCILKEAARQLKEDAEHLKMKRGVVR